MSLGEGELEWPGRPAIDPGIYVDLLMPAYNPYWQILFSGSQEAGRQVLVDWSTRKSSEFYVGNARLAYTGNGDLVGGYLAIDGSDVRKHRAADSFALLTGGHGDSFQGRLASLRPNMPSLPENLDGYCLLSKIAIAREFQATGLGKKVFARFLEEARKRFGHALIEVYSENKAARHIYESFGGSITATGTANSQMGAYLCYELKL